MMISGSNKSLVVVGVVLVIIAAFLSPFRAGDTSQEYAPHFASILGNFLNDLSGRSGRTPDLGSLIPPLIFISALALAAWLTARSDEDNPRVPLAFGLAVFSLPLAVGFAAASAVYMADRADASEVAMSGLWITGFGYLLIFTGLAAGLVEHAEGYTEMRLHTMQSLQRKEHERSGQAQR